MRTLSTAKIYALFCLFIVQDYILFGINLQGICKYFLALFSTVYLKTFIVDDYRKYDIF